MPPNLVERFLNIRQQFFFISDLFHNNDGTIAKVSEFLRKQAQPGDRVITNYEWEPLYFHTHLPQALKILPDYPIYQAAKLKELATETLIQVTVDENQDRVTELFDKYNLLTLPVVDEDGKLAGVITADDIISVLRQK